MTGPVRVDLDSKGVVDGLWRERECTKPKAGDDDLWIKMLEELHRLAARDMVVEVEHVKAQRTK